MASRALRGNRAEPQFPAQTLPAIEPGWTALTLDANVKEAAEHNCPET